MFLGCQLSFSFFFPLLFSPFLPSLLSSPFLSFLRFTYLLERERSRAGGPEGEGEGEKQAPCRVWSPTWVWTSQPRNHDLSQNSRQKLNRMNHSTRPSQFFFLSPLDHHHALSWRLPAAKPYTCQRSLQNILSLSYSVSHSPRSISLRGTFQRARFTTKMLGRIVENWLWLCFSFLLPGSSSFLRESLPDACLPRVWRC